MKTKHLVTFVGGLVAAGAVHAAEFSWEPSGAANELDSPFSALNVERSSFGLTYYFGAVDDAGGPLGLAAFFDPSSRISASIDHEKDETSRFQFGPPFRNLVSTTDEYSVGGRYVQPTSKWYFGGRYAHGDIDPGISPRDIDGDTEGYGMLVGKYLGADTTVELGFDSSLRQDKLGPPVCVMAPCTGSMNDIKRDEWSVAAQHVWHGGALAYSLWGRIAETKGTATAHNPPITIGSFIFPSITTEFDIPRANVYSAAGEIFPTRKLGVRLGYSRWDGDLALDDAYDVSATWFVTHKVGVALSFSRQRSTDGFVDHSDNKAVSVVGRF
ncbi:MAG TPA: hypothetical protein VE907_01495 [Gammaproteobacteria bacterium]|nr:hypothetical protein [Gammaproteobacteria bacterium]